MIHGYNQILCAAVLNGNNAEGLLPLEIKNLPSVGGLSGGTIAGLATCDKGFFPFSSLRVCGDYDQYEITVGAVDFPFGEGLLWSCRGSLWR